MFGLAGTAGGADHVTCTTLNVTMMHSTAYEERQRWTLSPSCGCLSPGEMTGCHPCFVGRPICFRRRAPGSSAMTPHRSRAVCRSRGHPCDNGRVGDGDETAGQGWLLLIYRVPTEPSRLRSAVWRRLKSLGAIYLQNSAAALPASVGAERALRKLRREILDMAGTAVLLSCSVLAGEQEILTAFQAARDDEYAEIADKCEDFQEQVRKEYVADHFTYAELEENEVDLVKLRNWLARVRQRDVFGASGLQAAEHGLAACEQSLEEYAARVYAEEAESR